MCARDRFMSGTVIDRPLDHSQITRMRGEACVKAGGDCQVGRHCRLSNAADVTIDGKDTGYRARLQLAQTLL
jgi:hypothetical protein